MRALTEEAAQHRLPQRPRRLHRPSLSAEHMRCHDYLLLLLEPEREARCRVADRCLPALWNDRLPPDMALGSLSISKRMAPASGATSTSLTSTRSASW